MITIWFSSVMLLAVCMCLVLIRVFLGPSTPDRLVGLDTLNTMVIVAMVLMAAAFKEVIYVDVGIVYALLSFVSTLFISKYLEGGRF